MSKHETLVNILDQLRNEAPPENKRYYPPETDLEKLNQARARAFIHLFLKVKFGLIDFRDRERLVTDGSNDGGIDAYYIDKELKRIFLIQSKFRPAENNFQEKEISLSELLNMDVDRISDGEITDENGKEYNGKIKQLLRELSEISDIGRYKYEIIILANLKEKTPSKLKKLTGGFGAVVFDHERTYQELVFPVVTGTYYSANELKIYLSLSNKTSSSARISYRVLTEYKECEISVLFVPTLEIARTLHKFKNSVLKYNPRSYLELANNTVNKEIAKTITDVQTNEFALYNNGITMLSYGTEFNEKIGQKDKAQVIISQPQIINGGQTAFTLSRIYEENLSNGNQEELFADKEVLLKVITFPEKEQEDSEEQLNLIEAISKATNQQTPVEEADRRSNDRIQIEMQNAIFSSFGYFYERKRGEYADGIKAGYIKRSQIIERELFLRLCKACDLRPSEARRSSLKILFREDNFTNTLNDVGRHQEYFFAYLCYEMLSVLERKYSRDRNNRFGIATYGQALRYGKFAVVSACRLRFEGDKSFADVEQIVNSILDVWPEFESYVSSLPANSSYFSSFYNEEKGIVVQELNFDNYYKGRTLNADLRKYFTAPKKT
jgi:hypothetical protein